MYTAGVAHRAVPGPLRSQFDSDESENHRAAFSTALTRLKRALIRRTHRGAASSTDGGGRSTRESLGSFGARSASSSVSRRTEEKPNLRSKRTSWMSWSSLRRRGTFSRTARLVSTCSETHTDSYVLIPHPHAPEGGLAHPSEVFPPECASRPWSGPCANYTSYGHRWLDGQRPNARASSPRTASDEKIWSLWRSWLREKKQRSTTPVTVRD